MKEEEESVVFRETAVLSAGTVVDSSAVSRKRATLVLLNCFLMKHAPCKHVTGIIFHNYAHMVNFVELSYE